MDKIIPYESDIFYHPLGLRIWEQRHHFVDNVLEELKVTRVTLIILVNFIFIRFVISDVIKENS